MCFTGFPGATGFEGLEGLWRLIRLGTVGDQERSLVNVQPQMRLINPSVEGVGHGEKLRLSTMEQV